MHLYVINSARWFVFVTFDGLSQFCRQYTCSVVTSFSVQIISQKRHSFCTKKNFGPYHHLIKFFPHSSSQKNTNFNLTKQFMVFSYFTTSSASQNNSNENMHPTTGSGAKRCQYEFDYSLASGNGKIFFHNKILKKLQQKSFSNTFSCNFFFQFFQLVKISKKKKKKIESSQTPPVSKCLWKIPETEVQLRTKLT